MQQGEHRGDLMVVGGGPNIGKTGEIIGERVSLLVGATLCSVPLVRVRARGIAQGKKQWEEAGGMDANGRGRVGWGGHQRVMHSVFHFHFLPFY